MKNICFQVSSDDESENTIADNLQQVQQPVLNLQQQNLIQYFSFQNFQNLKFSDPSITDVETRIILSQFQSLEKKADQKKKIQKSIKKRNKNSKTQISFSSDIQQKKILLNQIIDYDILNLLDF